MNMPVGIIFTLIKTSLFNIELLNLDQFPQIGEIVEDGSTLEENALIKARYVNKITGLPSISDDTGLEATALNGKPGVYSARYAGPHKDSRDNMAKLISALKNKKDRSARFKTVIAFSMDGQEHTFEGVCKGEITREPFGEKGFGYDPIFKPEGENRTFAEMSLEEKAKLSHRGKAFKKFINYINSNGL